MEHSNNHSMKKEDVMYTCTMHPEIMLMDPGNCPKCGMKLSKTHMKNEHDVHSGHVMGDTIKMGFWGKFKMSMSMTMGMDHTGLAGREIHCDGWRWC